VTKVSIYNLSSFSDVKNRNSSVGTSVSC